MSFVGKINLQLCLLLLAVFLINVINGIPTEDKVLPGSGSKAILPGNYSAREARRSVVSGGLFSIVTFDNVACNGTNFDIGTCVSAGECTSMGGVSNGRCAGNYGVCCTVMFTCGATISTNNSYFVNPGFPMPVTGPLTCSVTVTQLKGATSLYLEFVEFDIRGPSGQCTNDTFNVSIQESNTVYPTLCGDNDAQHEYIQWSSIPSSSGGKFGRSSEGQNGKPKSFGSMTKGGSSGSGTSGSKFPFGGGGSSGTNTAVLTFTLAAGSDARYWKIRISQFKSSDPCNAPGGCTEYYTDLAGTVESYNYDNGQGEIIASNTCINQCFNLPSGYCSMTLQETAFQLPGTAPSTCTDTYLLINGQRYCGDTLNSNGVITVNRVTGVQYLTITFCTGDSNPDMDLGYSLGYSIQPCM